MRNLYEKLSKTRRTFCFLHEVEELYKKNLIKGGDLNNAIVIVDKIITKEKNQILHIIL